MSQTPKGRLYLIPTPIAEDSLHTIPPYVIERLHTLKYFVAERAKTARRFIKSTQPLHPLAELTFYELNKFTDANERVHFLDAALAGQDMGLLSEAGCPGVADPGARIVAQAHQLGIRVVPLVGPSSILLALMGSGMNGQSFTFHGYLSVKTPDLLKDLKRLEQAARSGQTQLFIEAPYRNRNVVEQALKTLQPQTLLGIAVDINSNDEYIRSLPIAQWRKEKLPELHKRPAIFMLMGG